MILLSFKAIAHRLLNEGLLHFAGILATFAFAACPVLAQYTLRDEHGDSIPTNWPPPIGSYADSSITVWFNHNTIDQGYLCEYWREPSPKSGMTLAWPPDGIMPIDTAVIKNSALVQTLLGLGALRMRQYTNFSPCRDTLSFARGGDTIRTPEFWNSFVVDFGSAAAVSAIEILTVLYGGAAIDFAEPLWRVFQDGNPPNDPRWTFQIDYTNAIHGIDMLGAWPTEHGKRTVKVGVVDDGFDFMHTDFGGGFGAAFRFVDGREYNSSANPPRVSPPTNGGGHGTPVAGFIGALTNNNQDVASIAGGWLPNEGVSLTALKCATDATGAFVSEPAVGTPLLAPGQYKALRHTVRKTVTLTNWKYARAWGRGMRSTGWSGAQPTDNTGASPTYQTGYTRVVGYGDANPSTTNLRDIGFQSNEATLETFCYTVYNKSTGAWIGWYPCTPDNVEYKYTVWGERTITEVADLRSGSEAPAPIAVRVEITNQLGGTQALIHYRMARSGPISIRLVDLLGRTVGSMTREVWSGEGEQTLVMDLQAVPSGMYLAVVQSASTVGSKPFAVVR